MADIEAGKVPVFRAAGAAWRFAVDNLVRLLPAAAILGVAVTVLEVALASLPAGGLTDPDGAPFILMEFAAGLVVRMFFAAVIFRLMLRDAFSRPTGLQFGADEIRILGAQIGAALVYAPIGLAFTLGPALVVFHRLDTAVKEAQGMLGDPQLFMDKVTAALGEGGAALLVGMMLILLLAMFWVMVRLCLVQAASFAEGRVVVLQTWRWTHGDLLRVAAAHVLAYVPAILTAAILLGLIGGLFAAPDTEPDGAALIGLKTIGNILAIIADIPSIALMVILYRGLRPQDFQAR